MRHRGVAVHRGRLSLECVPLGMIHITLGGVSCYDGNAVRKEKSRESETVGIETVLKV